MSPATLHWVLDTNVVLDWLVFADPALTGLTQAVQHGQIVLHAHPLSVAELQRVLDYPLLKLDRQRQTDCLVRYQSITQPVPVATHFAADNLLLPADFPLCKDPDDQLFLALAWHLKADALISRDKALLALRKRAARFELAICDVAYCRAVLTEFITRHQSPDNQHI